METSLSYTDRGRAYFSSDEAKWIKFIRDMQFSHPAEVQVIADPSENDGCIYAIIPVSWFKLKPRAISKMSDERKEELRERMRKIRESARKVDE